MFSLENDQFPQTILVLSLKVSCLGKLLILGPLGWLIT